MGMLFPVDTIELRDGNGLRGSIQAPHINVDTIRVGTRRVKRLDATYPAKGVSGHTGIERIRGEIFLATDNPEFA